MDAMSTFNSSSDSRLDKVRRAWRAWVALSIPLRIQVELYKIYTASPKSFQFLFGFKAYEAVKEIIKSHGAFNSSSDSRQRIEEAFRDEWKFTFNSSSDSSKRFLEKGYGHEVSFQFLFGFKSTCRTKMSQDVIQAFNSSSDSSTNTCIWCHHSRIFQFLFGFKIADLQNDKARKLAAFNSSSDSSGGVTWCGYRLMC